MRWVKVKFGDYYKEYSYLYDLVEPAEEGDRLLVYAQGEFKLVDCVAVYPASPPRVATKFILAKLNKKALLELHENKTNLFNKDRFELVKKAERKNRSLDEILKEQMEKIDREEKARKRDDLIDALTYSKYAHQKPWD